MIPNEVLTNSVVHQGHLEQLVRTLFEGEKVLTNVRKDASIKNPATGNFLEIDIWLPNLKLCFEFQDSYHYVSTWTSQLSIADIQVKDSFKHGWLRTQGQTVVVIPCWWDGSPESLQNAIKFHRPELLERTQLSNGQLVPLNPPLDQFKQPTIPDIGELMLASFPSTIGDISEIISPRNPWWLGEKYDGIRVCWHPKRNALYGRYGVPLEVAEPFNTNFVTHFLDGEIWFGRGTFNEAQKLVLTIDAMPWEFLRIIVFDDPARNSRSLAFEKRYANILKYLPARHPFLLQAYRILARYSKLAQHMSQEIIENGGEGIVLRRRGSLYTSGRSHTLLKLKATRADKEGLVVDITQDGLLVLQVSDGTTLTVPPPNDIISQSPIKIGDIVTFTYENHSRSDIPINPQVTRVRQDIEWPDVLRENSNVVASSPAVKPYGYWGHQKRKNMRLFFEQFARDNKIDPLVAEDWYSVSSQAIMEIPDGSTIIGYFGGSFIRTLVQLFPEVHFDESKFEIVPQKYWQVVANRRKFFFDLARAKGFDPLVAKNWYSITEKTMAGFKGASSVARYYNSSITRALTHLFPELNLNREAFDVTYKTSWKEIKDRKAFFERIAADKGFDPLVASNWYSISFNTFNSYQGASTIRKLYRGFKNALSQLYPKMRIDKTKFSTYSVPTQYWKDNKNIVDFFDSFAREKGFDSLKPENWYYHLNKKSILDYRGGITLMKYYGGFGKALLKSYPSIGLDTELLPRPSNYWADKRNCRKLFIDYAHDVGFEPLIAANWYSTTKKHILALKGGNSMLVRYSNSHIRALMDVFPEIALQRDKFVGMTKKLS